VLARGVQDDLPLASHLLQGPQRTAGSLADIFHRGERVGPGQEESQHVRAWASATELGQGVRERLLIRSKADIFLRAGSRGLSYGHLAATNEALFQERLKHFRAS
jgi:hypothetical protein